VVFERAGHMLPLERCAEVAEQILTVSYSASS
jgi:hypothetical protein